MLPFFAGPVSATGRTMLTVGDHAGRDDPADHHGDLPRGLPADAQAARGGGARARRHALGDDPHGGAPLRPLRGHQRRDARASAARSARRWPSRSSSRPPAPSRSTSSARDQPVDDRGATSPCSSPSPPASGEHADRVRPGPVRDHLAGQRRRARGSSTVGASSRGRTDDRLDTRRPNALRSGARRPRQAGELPRWAPWAILGRRARRRRRAARRRPGSASACGSCCRPSSTRRDLRDLARRRGQAQGHRPARDDRGHVGVPAGAWSRWSR